MALHCAGLLGHEPCCPVSDSLLRGQELTTRARHAGSSRGLGSVRLLRQLGGAVLSCSVLSLILASKKSLYHHRAHSRSLPAHTSFSSRYLNTNSTTAAILRTNRCGQCSFSFLALVEEKMSTAVVAHARVHSQEDHASMASPPRCCSAQITWPSLCHLLPSSSIAGRSGWRDVPLPQLQGAPGQGEHASSRQASAGHRDWCRPETHR